MKCKAVLRPSFLLVRNFSLVNSCDSCLNGMHSASPYFIERIPFQSDILICTNALLLFNIIKQVVKLTYTPTCIIGLFISE